MYRKPKFELGDCLANPGHGSVGRVTSIIIEDEDGPSVYYQLHNTGEARHYEAALHKIDYQYDADVSA